jgi:Icc-related predicted phosphoesterase
MPFFRRTRRAVYRIFFATDIHGSDRCYRKFLAAATAYEANALILGGDIAGKALVPIVAASEGEYEVTHQGQRRRVSENDLDALRREINFAGFYPRVCEPVEVARMRSDAAYLKRLFEQAIVEQVDAWCLLAAERLPPAVRCIITPGNDDPQAIDAVLASADRVECPEGQAVELGPVAVASLGTTNRTPWHTERELSEDELAEQIDETLSGHPNGRPLVFNFHCPPYGSGLDAALELDSSLRPVIRDGAVVEKPVGSTAVREAILKYRPRTALHGHIHEAKGVARIGETLCFNPGSDYSSGVLQGLILDLDEAGDHRSHLFTTG